MFGVLKGWLLYFRGYFNQSDHLNQGNPLDILMIMCMIYLYGVPVMVLDQKRSDSCEAVLAFLSSENTANHKKITFPDYVILLVRLLDTS
jgi:hypothetical protein